MKDQLFPIKYVSNQSQLSPHVIRAWERRYQTLAPTRTDANRRLYSLEDIEKLTLLRLAIEAGHTISQIAVRTVPELRELVKTSSGRLSSAKPESIAAPEEGHIKTILDQCIDAAGRLDEDELELRLTHAATQLGTSAFLQSVAVPLLVAMGDGWSSGTTRVSHEHLVSAVLRTFLGRQLSALKPPDGAPVLLLTTPVGQLHEFGTLVVAILAALQGWKSLFIGTNMPADEISGAAQQSKARAIALSIVYPPDDPKLVHDLWELRQRVGSDLPIIVGGKAADSYGSTLQAIHAFIVQDLGRLNSILDGLRTIGTIIPSHDS